MKQGILLTIVFLFLTQGLLAAGVDAVSFGKQEAAAIRALKVKPIHPLPDWDSPEDLLSHKRVSDEGSSGGRLKISFPVGLLATLLCFLMWKFLQSQE